ncbi:hypothetical protein [Actinophytocola sp.]|uniref:hypothetical protein n=1 Tax=Actinophytocola sp. TaxID=1872138 RepID=UPI003D6BD870
MEVLRLRQKPDDLPDRPRAAGLQPGEEEALMVADVADLPTDLPAPEGVELRAATDEAGLRLAKARGGLRR